MFETVSTSRIPLVKDAATARGVELGAPRLISARKCPFGPVGDNVSDCAPNLRVMRLRRSLSTRKYFALSENRVSSAGNSSPPSIPDSAEADESSACGYEAQRPGRESPVPI